MTYYMIDPSVTPYNSVQDIQDWIGDLQKNYPQDNPQVQDALERAEQWLENALQREQNITRLKF